MCKDTNRIDDLVAELDKFFGNGGSHMNVEFVDGDMKHKFKELRYNECTDGQNACGIPTEFFDDEEDV